jgi:uncharacterized damage-inducible protein DinB
MQRDVAPNGRMAGLEPRSTSWYSGGMASPAGSESALAPGILFLESSSEILGQMTRHIHDCFKKLDEDAIWRRQSAAENALGNLVLHLCGNVRQWIGCYVGGLEDIRKRPEEFSRSGGMTRADLLSRLDETIELANGVLKKLDPQRLTEVIPVQDGKSATVLEAIYHVVGHFQQHTGQIIFATKLATSEDLAFYKPSEKAPTNKQSV